jgi:hypothetical protein
MRTNSRINAVARAVGLGIGPRVKCEACDGTGERPIIDSEEDGEVIQYRFIQVIAEMSGDLTAANQARVAAAAVVRPMQPCHVCQGLGLASSGDLERWKRVAEAQGDAALAKMCEVARRLDS